MKPSTWLRALSVFLALFAAGHTLGTVAPRAAPAPQQAADLAAMQSVQFPIMGFIRSYWDFYYGFALIISVHLALLAVIAWQAGDASRRSAEAALPLAYALLAGCVVTFALCCRFFFAAPIVVSAAAVVCSIGSVWTLLVERGREMRRVSVAAARP